MFKLIPVTFKYPFLNDAPRNRIFDSADFTYRPRRYGHDDPLRLSLTILRYF